MNTPINEEVVSTATFGEDIKDGNAIYLKDGGAAFALTKNQELFPLKHLFSIVDGLALRQRTSRKSRANKI